MPDLTAVFTVTINTRPGGDYYADHSDLVANALPWIEGALEDRDDIADVTVTAHDPDTTPPADRANLRDRIADTLAAADGWKWVDGFDKARSSTYRGYQQRADAVLAVLPEPADRAAVLREAADDLPDADLPFVPPMDRRRVADWLRLMAGETPATTEADNGTRTADLLAASATEYRVPVPEAGGTNLIVRRQGTAFGAGWSVAVPGWGGGRAWTAEGWQDSISALSVDRLFCWPDADTAVTETRRALAAGARQDGSQP